MKSITSRLKEHAGSRWYFSMVLLFAFLDAYILVVPNEAILVSAVLARRARWVSRTLLFSLSSTAGVTLLSAASSFLGRGWVTEKFPDLFSQNSWVTGVLGSLSTGQGGGVPLFLLALSPFPVVPGAVLAGLYGIPLGVVFVSFFAGKAVKYLVVSKIAVTGAKAIL